MRKKICIFGSVGINRGDDLMNRVLFNMFSSFQCEVVVASKAHIFYAKEYGCTSFNSSIKNIFGWLTNIYKSDVIVVGGGTLIQEDFGKNSVSGILIYGALVIFISKMMRKKILVLSLGVNRVSGINRIFSKLYSLADIVAVRDDVSVVNLLKNDINVVKVKAGDVGLCRRYYDPVGYIEPSNLNCEYVCLSLAKEHLGDSVLEIGRKVVDYSVKLGFSVKLIAMDVRDEEELSLYKVLESEYHQYVKLIVPNNPFEIIPVIQNAKMLFGMRLHFCVLSFVCGRKPIIISREGKTEWLRFMADNVKFFDFHNESLASFDSFLSSLCAVDFSLTEQEIKTLENKINEVTNTYLEIIERVVH